MQYIFQIPFLACNILQFVIWYSINKGNSWKLQRNLRVPLRQVSASVESDSIEQMLILYTYFMQEIFQIFHHNL